MRLYFHKFIVVLLSQIQIIHGSIFLSLKSWVLVLSWPLCQILGTSFVTLVYPYTKIFIKQRMSWKGHGASTICPWICQKNNLGKASLTEHHSFQGVSWCHHTNSYIDLLSHSISLLIKCEIATGRVCFYLSLWEITIYSIMLSR